jgi:peptide/nickel transport system substrate-binding protein
LVRNPNWDQATDPNRKPLPDRIEVALNINSDDIDNRLLAGDLDGTSPAPVSAGHPGTRARRREPAP